MIVPLFPRFVPLKENHRRQIETVTLKFDSYSDFNFTSLLCWNVDDSAEISLLNNNLVIKLPDYLTGEPVFSILGNTKIDDSLNQLGGHIDRLNLVPQVVVDSIGTYTPKAIANDRDSHDYIYDLHSLHSLSGQRYKKIRNKLNRFEQDFANRKVRIEKSSIITPRIASEILAIYDAWAGEPDNCSILNPVEKSAIDRLLKYSENINFLLVELFIDDTLVGFSSNEILPDGNAICHFEKALNMHPGIYTYLVHATTASLLEFGCTRVNWEQDLGIAGLRQSKTSYRPTEMLTKYTVHL